MLRWRLLDADALNERELHSFNELMRDKAALMPEAWSWEAFEELDEQGHLAHVSHRAFGGDAYGRQSTDGRRYLQPVSA